MWPFNRKPNPKPAPEPELTPFDTQVLTLMGLAPDKCKVNRDKLSIDGVGVFTMLKGRDGAPIGRMQYEALDSLSARTRRLSLRGQREVYAKHQEILDSAQPGAPNVPSEEDGSGAAQQQSFASAGAAVGRAVSSYPSLAGGAISPEFNYIAHAVFQMREAQAMEEAEQAHLERLRLEQLRLEEAKHMNAFSAPDLYIDGIASKKQSL